MRIVLSTHSGLFFVEAADDGSVANLKELSFGYYYGLAVYPDFILAARRVDPWSCKISPTVFEMWNHDGICIGLENRIDGNSITDCHEMARVGDELYVCNLGKHCVEVFDSDFNRISTLSFSEGNIPGGKMVNSIGVDGKDFWLLFHNRGAPSFVQHLRRDRDDFIFCRRIGVGSPGAHNVVIDGDKLYYNASPEGAVHMIEPDTVDTEDWDKKGKIFLKYRKVGDEIHTKGLALDKESKTLVVGVSDKGTLDDRFVSESHITFLDSESLEYKFHYPLHRSDGRTIGNINEIKILD